MCLMTKKNTEKRKIDKKRDGALSFEMPNSEGDSFKKIISGSGKLHIVNDESIHLITMADDIDPERTNINVPHTNKVALEYGFNNDVVQRIFLLAETLFNRTHLGSVFESESAITHSFEATKLLLEMREIYEYLGEDVNAVIKKGLLPRKGGSQNIPITKNLETRIKTFIHKVDRVRDIMIQLLKLFYEIKPEKKLLDNIREAISIKHGSETPMTIFFDQIRPGLEFSRNLRNAIEHPSDQKKLIILDYNLSPDASVDPPTIEFLHPETDQPKTDAVSFLKEMGQVLTDQLEILIVNLCAINLGHFGGFECGITKLSPEIQKHRGTWYAYAVKINGEWQPLG